MVARPPVILRIEPMQLEDLPEVHAIERASFEAPWPPEAYRTDLAAAANAMLKAKGLDVTGKNWKKAVVHVTAGGK